MADEHFCHWPACQTEVPPKLFMCRAHWYRLPSHYRLRILKTYRPGQEITKTPTKSYLMVVASIMEWIRQGPTEVRP